MDELEELGYVERRADPTDRRAKRIHLTRRGKRTNAIEWDVVRKVEDALGELLGTKRLQTPRRSLQEIVDAYTLAKP